MMNSFDSANLARFRAADLQREAAAERLARLATCCRAGGAVRISRLARRAVTAFTHLVEDVRAAFRRPAPDQVCCASAR